MQSQIKQAVALFVVASWSDNEAGIVLARKQIAAFEAGCTKRGASPLTNLQTLEIAFGAKSRDSATGKAIRLVLQQRIAALVLREIAESGALDPVRLST